MIWVVGYFIASMPLGFKRNKKLYTSFLIAFALQMFPMTSVEEIIFSGLLSVSVIPLLVVVGSGVRWG